MSFKIVIKEDAASEIEEVYNYYEKQKTGLGQRFIVVLEFAVNALSETPHHYSFLFSSTRFRSYTLDVFLYSIIYEIINEEVLIYAGYNTYKNPVILYKRLPK